jgi:hypothetical protein
MPVRPRADRTSYAPVYKVLGHCAPGRSNVVVVKGCFFPKRVPRFTIFGWTCCRRAAPCPAPYVHVLCISYMVRRSGTSARPCLHAEVSVFGRGGPCVGGDVVGKWERSRYAVSVLDRRESPLGRWETGAGSGSPWRVLSRRHN